MKIDISGRHRYEVSDMISDYTHEKMSKLEKYGLDIESAHVIFEAEKMNESCEIVLTGKGIRCTAKQTTKAMQASLDSAITKLQHQLQRHHDKIKHHDRSSVRGVNPEEANVGENDVDDGEDE